MNCWECRQELTQEEIDDFFNDPLVGNVPIGEFGDSDWPICHRCCDVIIATMKTRLRSAMVVH